MKTIGKIILAALTLATIPTAATAENVWKFPADFQRSMDNAARGGARGLATAALTPNTTMKGLGAGGTGWTPVTQADMVKDAGYPLIKGYVYATDARVDFDGDGVADVARFVKNGRQGGVMVYFGDAKKAPMLVFRSNRQFGNGDGLFAAGANRLLINIPEARQHVLFMQGGAPKVHTIGD